MQNIKRITKILIFLILILLFSFQYKVNAEIGSFGFRRYKNDTKHTLTSGTITVWQQAVYYNNTYCVQHGTMIPKGGKYYTIYGRGSDGYQVANNEISNKLAYILYTGTNNNYNDYRTNAQKALWEFLYENRNKGNTDVDRILKGIKNNINSYSYSGTLLSDADNYAESLKNFSITIDKLTSGTLTGKVNKGSFSKDKITIEWGYDTTYSKHSTGVTKKNDGSFTITGITPGKTVYVKATAPKYNVNYYILRRSDGQDLITVTKIEEGNIAKTAIAKEATINTDISLQKYITKVNGSSVADRSQWITSEYDEASGYNKKVSKSLDAKTYDKYSKPKEIETDDKVTYKIIVYNNADTEETVGIKDQMAYYIDDDNNVVSYSSIVKVYDVSDSKDVTYTDDTSNYNCIQFTDTIPANGSKEYEITLEYTGATTEILKNNVWIAATEHINKTSYRTHDADYIKIKQNYAVSLEKYICEIDGNQLGYTEDYDFNDDGRLTAYEMLYPLYWSSADNNVASLDENKVDVNNDGRVSNLDALEIFRVMEKVVENRRNKPVYGQLKFKSEVLDEEDIEKALDTWKRDNPVEASSDSTITYSIELFNDSKRDVYISEITDKFQLAIKGTDILYTDVDGPSSSTDEGSKEDDVSFIYSVSATVSNAYLSSASDSMQKSICNLGINGNDLIIMLSGKQGKIGANQAIRIDLTVKLNSDQINKIDLEDLNLEDLEIQNTASISKMGLYDKSGNYFDVKDTTLYDNTDSDYVKVEKKADVSLQKYITKVTDASGSITTYNDTTDRANLKTVSGDSEECNRDINKWLGTCPNVYKYDKPVSIEAGDKVTYRIYVYNNSDEGILKKATIRDQMPYTIIDSTNVSLVDVISVKDKNGTAVSYGYFADNTGIEWETGKIDKESFTYYDVTLQFKTYSSSILTNTASIYTTKPSNSQSTTYRTTDRDYIQMKEYKIKLEKYVSGVESTGKTGTALETDINSLLYNSPKADRSGLAQYDDLSAWKKNNPVMVEAGDKVTYTIILTNTGETDINYVEFKDVCPAGLEYKSCTIGTYNSGTVAYTGKMDPYAGKATLTLTYEVTENTANSIIENTAEIFKIKNRNGVEVPDSDGTTNNKDSDWIKLKGADEFAYMVSLEKYIISVNGDATKITTDRSGHPIYNPNGYYKNNYPVTINSGDFVTYEIKVKNDATKTAIKISKVLDTLPKGVSIYKLGDYSSSDSYNTVPEDKQITIETTKDKLLNPGEETSIFITVQVTEPNISVDILENDAKITEIQNRNSKVVSDTTPSDNEDKDWIQLNDIEKISGMVWNDKATDKASKNYNGTYDVGETPMEGIEVYLYRYGISDPLAHKTTDADGKYEFKVADFNVALSLSPQEQYLKGAKSSVSDTDKWCGEHYRYYVTFEYDGITYTATIWTQVGDDNDQTYVSNAKEDIENVTETREHFNSRFETINNSNGIDYTTKNEDGYMPQSNHVYDSSTMSIQSSTGLIVLKNDADLEKQLTHIDLGLKGKQIFDLELNADVFQVDVSVNGTSNIYNWNEVGIREVDTGMDSTGIYVEDMSNINSDGIINSKDYYDQGLWRTDIATDAEVATLTTPTEGASVVDPYTSTNLNIEVTYELTIKNMSETHGTATKIVDYYDTKYEFENAYYVSGGTINYITGITPVLGSDYNCIEINTQATTLKQGDEMVIYVVYSLIDPTDTLRSYLLKTPSEKLPTYNIAEITEYKTSDYDSSVGGYIYTKYDRGLIDKDSAPGSANKEQVRTTDTIGIDTPTSGGSPTTVEYYFQKTDLNKLKYEDDTSAVPVLYFKLNESVKRTLTGTVFEDNTSMNYDNVKSGNGRFDEDETTISGVTVILYEYAKKADGSYEYIKRYSYTTGSDGKYTFDNFLPGNYMIAFYYGHNKETFYKENAKSYNGEDFQSTNNMHIVPVDIDRKSYIFNPADVLKTDGTKEITKENGTKINVDCNNYWYFFTGGTSIATDDSGRRKTVSEDNAIAFTENDMIILNKARVGTLTDDDVNNLGEATDANGDPTTSILGRTFMFANTKNMRFNVENTYEEVASTGEYKIENMNFGIAEVNVTTLDLKKQVEEFSITDSTGNNIIARAVMNASSGKLEVKTGDVQPIASNVDISIEDNKLQGARLEVKYKITVKKEIEKNFDGSSVTDPGILGLIDFVNNNLTYNTELGNNSTYWELISYNNVQKAFNSAYVEGTTTPRGSIDPNGEKYSVVLKLKDDKVSALDSGTTSIPITLEKVLSSTDATLEDIITSTVDSFNYANTVEITKLNYGGNNQKDRIRTIGRFIIVPGAHYDFATSETIVIHPPTGATGIDTIYYVIAVISLMILAAGVFGIKKFVLKK